MKNCKFLFVVFLFTCSLGNISCMSREKKVAETIKADPFKTLYDFDSYQPVETKIDTLKNNRYGDTLMFDNGMMFKVF